MIFGHARVELHPVCEAGKQERVISILQSSYPTAC